jgi:hypothetical protein
MRRATALCVSALLSSIAVSPSVMAAEESRERKITTGEIESWLEGEPGAKPVDKGTDEDEEAPLPAPRRHGLTIESGVGFQNHLGELKHITPVAPWFQVRVGYEFLPWVMPFVEADLSFAQTSYANRPPPPRSFWQYGAGAGLRLCFAISDAFGVLAQGSLGFSLISEQNVLSVYGFPNADEPNLYLGAEIGFEWYPVNPHLALGVRAGLRTYPGLARDPGESAPFALIGSGQIRYTF